MLIKFKFINIICFKYIQLLKRKNLINHLISNHIISYKTVNSIAFSYKYHIFLFSFFQCESPSLVSMICLTLALTQKGMDIFSKDCIVFCDRSQNWSILVSFIIDISTQLDRKARPVLNQRPSL